MAKVQSLNDFYIGAVAKTYKSQRVKKSDIGDLLERSKKTDRYAAPIPSAPKHIIMRTVNGIRIPFILKKDGYIPMKLIQK